MMAIMTGKSDYYTTSTLSGNRLRNTGSIDKNLDGVIDEKDDAVSYDFRFALLTTNSSYSCGNFLPCLAQKQGIPVVGQVSGGGTCALINPVFPNKTRDTGRRTSQRRRHLRADQPGLSQQNDLYALRLQHLYRRREQ